MNLTEQLDAAQAKLDALLAAMNAPEPAAETTQTVTAAQALGMITEELSKDISKERAAYLKSVVEELAKSGFESTTVVEIKVLHDPTQLLPKTEPSPTLQSIAAASPESGFASNMSAVQKVALIQKLLINSAELKKSAISDKLDEIQTLFGLTDDDMEDSYDMSWKIRDLVVLLQNAAKIETVIGGVKKSATTPAPTAAPTTMSKPITKSKPETEPVWPRDMASAKFDPVTKSYAPEANDWGPDSKA